MHQFRFVQEAARRNLNLTKGCQGAPLPLAWVSKAIIELEGELGVEIFARHGKRLKRITEPGQHVLKASNSSCAGRKPQAHRGTVQRPGQRHPEHCHHPHTGRYVLPVPVARLREAYPKVNISLHRPRLTRWRAW